MKIEFDPRSTADLNSAVDYYNKQRENLGDELRSCVYEAIDRIRQNPEHCIVIEAHIRRCLVRRFPYSVLFRLPDPKTVRILAIRHQSRHPNFGLDRR